MTRHRSPCSRIGAFLVAWLAVLTVLTVDAVAQQDPGRLQRDQGEILRKAERLRGLMDSLLSRYQKEGDAEKVRLLREGLSHLEESGLMQDVASVRNSLDAGQMAEALRKQSEVVSELEQLLAILLERPTAESLEEEIERTEALARTAAELARRQAELQAQVDAIRQGDASEAERELAEQLAELARAARREARENERQDGVRRPTLEAAIERIERLLAQQGQLEERVRDERGDGSRSAQREFGFRIGALREDQEEVQAARARSSQLEDVAREADELRSALASGDDARARQQRDRTQTALQTAAQGTDDRSPTERQRLESLAEELANTPAPDGSGEKAGQDRQALDDLARRIGEAAREMADRSTAAAARQQEALAERAAALAGEADDPQQTAIGTETAKALREAAAAMRRAADATREDDPERADSAATRATRRAAEARQAFRQANPDAESQATRMADEAQRTGRSLRAASSDDPDTAEARAAEDLGRAEQALREAAEQSREAPQSGQPADGEAVERALGTSRQSLDEALETLRDALDASNQGRENALDAARQRNEELAGRAADIAERTQQAGEQGQIDERQAQQAAGAMQEAQDAMEAADRALEAGAQSQAANQQRRAAEAMDRATRELSENRPVDDQQRQQLQDLADEQRAIQEDIIRLAELLEERENQRAQESLSRAQQSAGQAEQSLKRGDPDSATEQQQDTREQLERAQQELEQERDRYQDLRQEELLFKIEEELQQFLDAQREITAETATAASALRDGARMTRPMRRTLNRLGEDERELGGKVRYVREALAEEGTLVFTHVLESNERDLEDVADRLSSRSPDAGEFTLLLQHDIEERTLKLLEAIERERQRRREQRRQEQQQQGQQQNQFGPQRERLVPIISELIMLKQLEEEMLQRTTGLERLIQAAGADGVSDVEAAMAERLAHQHNALTAIFEQLRAQLEQALQPQADEGEEPNEGRGR